jgi:hypothetical protein
VLVTAVEAVDSKNALQELPWVGIFHINIDLYIVDIYHILVPIIVRVTILARAAPGTLRR